MSKLERHTRFLGLLALLTITQVPSLLVFAQGLAALRKNKSLSPEERADLLVKQMTLDEKIQLVHGGFGYDLEGWKKIRWLAGG